MQKISFRTEEARLRFQELTLLRRKHGFGAISQEVAGSEFPKSSYAKQGQYRAGKWSRALLADPPAELHLPQQLSGDEIDEDDRWRPKNAPLLNFLEERLAVFRFRWEIKEFVQVSKYGTERTRKAILYTNYPTVGGVMPTLTDLAIMPLELFDGYRTRSGVQHLLQKLDKDVSFPARQVMEETGIGYKGLSGVSWLPAYEAYSLPSPFFERLQELGNALFLFFDAVTTLYGKDERLTSLLLHKVPVSMPLLMETNSVDFIRPDIVIVRDPDGSLRPVITELESAPAGHGMLHAMQCGYGFNTDIVDHFVRYLDGRAYIVFATHEWSEYLWDQATFCAALRERGVDARVIFDRTIKHIHEDVRQSWQPPKDALADAIQGWNNDFIGRLDCTRFNEFVDGSHPMHLNGHAGDAVVFRFGYFDNFSVEALECLRRWQTHGATITNPLQFSLENKALMAAVWLPEVAALIHKRDPAAVGVLRACVAETRLLDPTFTDMSEIGQDRNYWLTKFGAWDGENKSWGSRSLVVGAQLRPDAWIKHLTESLRLPHPVIAQHVIRSMTESVAYVDTKGVLRVLDEARTRLTPFFLRSKEGCALHCGSLITLRAKTMRVHGATDAVEAPVVYARDSTT